jgi:ElaB/YqjD/DUF883 family membrane-anchored ribosome-binding protein
MNGTDLPSSSREFSSSINDGGLRNSELVRGTDRYLRENPVPAVLGALAVGFAVGLLTRLVDQKRRPTPLRDAVDESADVLRGLFVPAAKKTRQAYRQSASAVREAIDQAADKAREIDVDDYVDPVTKWWRRLFS